MSNPRNRSKHLQSRSWYRIIIDDKVRIVRPVDGRDWFDEPGFEFGVVHLIDDNSDIVARVDIGFFNKNATRLGDNI